MSNMQPYAVIFKTVAIDRFVARQLARVVAAAGAGHVYLMLDETHGSAGPIAFDRVIRYREADLISLGFTAHAQGSLFWYNADYPLYYFQHLHDQYDVIVMIEYDVVFQASLDELVQTFRAEKLDLVAQPIDKPLDEYWWTNSMLHFYRREQVFPVLICTAIVSANAARYLAACRRAQGGEAVTVAQWPIGEAFVGTAARAGGLQCRAFSAFGKLARYDWWPPTHESELRDFPDQIVLHPVLTGRRYANSLFKNGKVTGLVACARLNVPRVFVLMCVRSIWTRVAWAWSGGRRDRALQR